MSKQCASKWVNRFRRCGELGLRDRSSVPHRSLAATPVEVVARIEQLWRTKWSARRTALELAAEDTYVSVRTVGRHLARLGSTGAGSWTRPVKPTGHRAVSTHAGPATW